MAHDLPDRAELEACGLDMFRPFGLDIGAEASEDRLVQGREIVPKHRLARRYGDVVPTGDREDATAHRAVVPHAIAVLPDHDRNREVREEIRVTWQYPEAAAGVFGARDENADFFNDDRERRDNAEPHDAPSFLAPAASFSRASSMV